MSPAIQPERIKSILIIRFQRLGDLILVMALVQNLRRAFPDARITLMCQAMYADYFRHQPGLDHVIAVPDRKGLKGQLGRWFAVFRKTLLRRFDLVIDLSDNKRSTLLTRLSAARLRMGYSPPARGLGRRGNLEFGSHNIYATNPGADLGRSDHFIAQFLAPLQSLGVPIYQDRPVLAASKADRETVDRMLEDTQAARFAVIHPGARTLNRRWPVKNYAPVIAHLSNHGIKAVVIGDQSERALVEEIAGSSGVPFIDLVGKLSLGRTTALLERCSLYIGNNTGPIHIAAGVGARVVAIYGNQPVNDDRWTPLVEGHSMVKPKVPCACLDPAACDPADPDRSLCVWSILVPDVLKAIDDQIAAAGAAADLRT